VFLYPIILFSFPLSVNGPACAYRLLGVLENASIFYKRYEKEKKFLPEHVFPEEVTFFCGMMTELSTKLPLFVGSILRKKVFPHTYFLVVLDLFRAYLDASLTAIQTAVEENEKGLLFYETLSKFLGNLSSVFNSEGNYWTMFLLNKSAFESRKKDNIINIGKEKSLQLSSLVGSVCKKGNGPQNLIFLANYFAVNNGFQLLYSVIENELPLGIVSIAIDTLINVHFILFLFS
jgi:hypothetical protein